MFRNQTKNDNSNSFKKKNKRKERLDDFGNPLDNGIYYNAKHGYRVRVYCEEHGKYKIHVWEIPENKIKLKDDNTKGVMGLNVHASEEDRIKFNFGPPPSPISCKSLWTREYYSKYKIF